MFAHLRMLVPLAFISVALAAPSPLSGPSVKLDKGTFVGATDGSSYRFLGIPFAKPPTGNLRFNLPVAVDPYTGTHSATSFGLSCPQQEIRFNLTSSDLTDAVNDVVDTFYSALFPDGEDCLTVNVWTPTTTKSAKLPVVVWIFGGGFEFGSPAQYDGGIVVNQSIDMDEPVVYVSINYRVSAFGFLGGSEIKKAGLGNLGLQDQRLALRWVQKYISNFGGDPTKVTIWGESAGAISVGLHMVANNGNNEGLFRGAFMQSGAPVPVGDISNGQADYDQIVSATGCASANDTLQCLRTVDYNSLKAAVDNSASIAGHTSLHLPWLPKADGVFLTDTPYNLVKKGAVADVPFITGNNDDEGTLFAVALSDIITDNDFQNYIHSNYIPGASSSQMKQLLQLYPSDIAQGSPYGTSILDALTPQFKRLASIQGDLVFQAPRRNFLQQRSSRQNAWSFVNKRLKVTPFLGTFHASDLLITYGAGDMAEYLINFVNYLDPNSQSLFSTLEYWPTNTNNDPEMMTFDTLPSLYTSLDTYRQDAMQFLITLSSQYPI